MEASKDFGKFIYRDEEGKEHAVSHRFGGRDITDEELAAAAKGPVVLQGIKITRGRDKGQPDTRPYVLGLYYTHGRPKYGLHVYDYYDFKDKDGVSRRIHTEFSGRKLSPDELDVLASGMPVFLDGLVNRNGAKYSMPVIADEYVSDYGKVSFTVRAISRSAYAEIMAANPDPSDQNTFTFNGMDGQEHTISRSFFGHELTENELTQLVIGNPIILKGLIDPNGDAFDSPVRLSEHEVIVDRNPRPEERPTGITKHVVYGVHCISDDELVRVLHDRKNAMDRFMDGLYASVVGREPSKQNESNGSALERHAMPDYTKAVPVRGLKTVKNMNIVSTGKDSAEMSL